MATTEPEGRTPVEGITASEGRTALVAAVGGDEEDGKLPTYKSFKKKFRKMKLKFDEAMRESNDLYMAEQKALEAVKRIKEENDRILDFLLDVNDSAQLPIDKRIDIQDDIFNLTRVPPLISEEDLSKAAELQTPEGRAIYQEIQNMLAEKAAETASSRPSKSIGQLLSRIPHLTSEDAQVQAEVLPSLEPAEGHSTPYAYPSIEQIDDYIWDIDALLGHVPPVPHAPHAELVFGHQHSPYNWLRRHVPQIFLQDGEGSEKSNGKPGALRGAGKRASLPAPSKPDALEIVEEDGIGYDFALGGASKGKRKREDDDIGYHPKTGDKAKKPRQARKKKDATGDTHGMTSSGRKKKPKIPSPPPGAHPFGPL